MALPSEIRRKEEKQRDKQREVAKYRFENMLTKQMETPEGRNFVDYILKLLHWNEPNTHNSADSYRLAAMQNVAITIHNDLYNVVPEQVEKLMREDKEKVYVLRQETAK